MQLEEPGKDECGVERGGGEIRKTVCRRNFTTLESTMSLCVRVDSLEIICL
jgi:hypothetical protein